MQAMVLVDNYRLLCDVDTLLGTDGIAQLNHYMQPMQPSPT